jgi:hypothetical protein
MTPGTAGYSGTPLPRKLGIRDGHRVLLAGAPADFDLGDLPALGLHDVEVQRRAGATPYDVILAFTPDHRTLVRKFPDLARRLVVNGGLWIAWPKRSSGVPTDVDENIVREFGLDAGLVDNKVCAVDETWSGLRFVVRLRDR